MKIWKRGLLIMLALLTCFATACGANPKDPTPDTKDTSASDTETDPSVTPPEDPPREPVAPLVQRNTVTIETGDTRLVVEGQKNNLVIKSLATLDGAELVPADSDFALPSEIWSSGRTQELTWKFKQVDVTESTENGTPLYTVTFRFSGKTSVILNGLWLDVSFLTRPLISGPIEVRTSFINETDVDVQLIPGDFASITLSNIGEVVQIAKESGTAEGYHNPWEAENIFGGDQGLYRYNLADGDEPVVSWVNTIHAFNCSGFIPMLYLTGNGGGAYAALEWSSGRVIATPAGGNVTFTVDMDGTSKMNFIVEANTIVGANVSGDPFKTKVPAQTAFAFPSVYLGVFDGSLDNGSNVFKHWFFNCKSPEKLRNDPNEPFTQMDMRDGLNNLGAESLKWDYGWWSNDVISSFEKSAEGSWELRDDYQKGVVADAGCSTMAELGAKLKSMGINWTVYVLLHDNKDANGAVTEAFGEFNSITHPEWFSNQDITLEMGHPADLGNEECVEYLKETLTHLFADNNIGTWRTDFAPIVFGSDKENRHAANGSDTIYWCTVGFRDLVNHLYENVPDFRYESCNSGGAMKDLFTATLAVSINADDSGSYLSLRTTFYDSSYVIPPAQLQLPASADEFDRDYGARPPVTTTAPLAEIRNAIKDMQYRSILMGSPMYMCGPERVDREYYPKYMNLYKEKIRPLVREAELYHILPRPDGVNFDGVMYADPDTKNEIKGLVFLFKPSEEPGNVVHVPIEGLFPDVTYQLSFEDRPEQNLVATGADLMNNGIDVTIEYVGSELIWITEAKLTNE